MAAFGGMSFSLYRVVHQSHHAHLATERDEELWPFVHPGVSRPREFSPQFSNWVSECFTRRSCSSAHLSGRDRRFEKRTCAGASGRSSPWRYACGLSFWEPCLVRSLEILHLATLAPAWLAANMQSLRKYIEHVGLMGSTVNSSTGASSPMDGWENSWRSLCCTSLFMVSITGILDSLTPNFPSSLLSSSRRGRMNDRPFRVIGKHFKISSEAWQILASVRSGTSQSPWHAASGQGWLRRLGAASIQPDFGHEFFIARWRGRQAARLRGGRSEEGFRRWAGALRGVSFRSEGDFSPSPVPAGAERRLCFSCWAGSIGPPPGHCAIGELDRGSSRPCVLSRP